MPQPTTQPVWTTLETLARTRPPLADLFASDPHRLNTLHATGPGMLLDLSKNAVTPEVMTALLALARAQNVEGQRDAMLNGAPVNTSEKRAVLHTAMRRDPARPLVLDGRDRMPGFTAELDRMRAFAARLHAQPGTITDVLHLGIGGQDLGVKMVTTALSAHAHAPRLHFVANVDGHALAPRLTALNPATTLVVISSKTFTTPETMMNAARARAWLATSPGANGRIVAITANAAAAAAFGVLPQNILTFPETVGGRFSLWSAAGLAVALHAGVDALDALHAGARAMDDHFATTPLAANIPVLLALMGIWSINFCGYHQHGIVPYDQRLASLATWVQQVDMESNGKSIDRDGARVAYATAPLIMGDAGTGVQHSFFQALHQGTTIMPLDFIVIKNADHDWDDHHQTLQANALAQSQALMIGQAAPTGDPWAHYDGNRPSNTIILDRLDAWHLGALMAAYEHKTAVMGMIWHLNSFDQPGVALGKQLANRILRPDPSAPTPDSSTAGLLAYLRS
jgi:glucose-6-phosphate isomerase